MRWISLIILAMAAALVAAAAVDRLGDNGQAAATDLTITVNRGLGSQWGETVYHLRCDPVGGDVPRAAAVCEALAHHRDLFLDPPPERFTCVGGLGVPPSIEIEGHYRDDEVQVGWRSCDWPGELGLAVIRTATLSDQSFELAVARLRCGEDPRLLTDTDPSERRWERACLRDPLGWRR